MRSQITSGWRNRRQVALWITATTGLAACLIVGLRLTAMASGTMLLVALGAEALRRARDDDPRISAGRRSGSAVVWVAAIAWALAGLTTLTVPAWSMLVDLLIAGALVTSVLAVRKLRRPMLLTGESSNADLAAARAIIEEHGEDSLSPFLARPDKSFEFGAGGVLGYRVVGDTAVVSGDPVGPPDAGPELLAQLLSRAHRAGMRVTLYGGSERHLEAYREWGLRALCVGEEAVVDPARFTLEGRAVRKLRQSVHRVQRRGWTVAAREGREIDGELEAEIDALERAWRAQRSRMLGFAMAMGDFDPGVRPADLYLLAWSPEGELRGVMRFLAHRGKLSLDTMRRVGETPNGLNEALVCAALEFARERRVGEVSLNYAGLAHLIRRGPSGNPARRALTAIVLHQLGRHFQMDRLVRFNEKFSPQWRPRYLVYESRTALPRSLFRVLQAEGYLPERQHLISAPAGLSDQLKRLRPLTARIDGRLDR